MAAAVATVSVASLNQTTMIGGNLYSVIGTLSINANPATYTTGGIVCSLSHPLIKAQRPPQFVDILSVNGNLYTYIPGTNISNGLLKIFTAIGTELGNGVAIPATNSGDTINFQALWLGML